MDNSILKKKLGTYVTETGRLQGVTDEILFELLTAWEYWPGQTKDFYKSIGFPSSQLAFLMGKAKKLKREGRFPAEEFKEVNLENLGVTNDNCTSCPIEISWDNGKVIRFGGVDLLVDFLKKVA
ncbi:MAG: hypothetical protein COW78_11125 [Bdellovibrio sp. CG22_combo_CG10-13_8_21_14_all_39_27]|nr:MAG: hypothetical protein COW78_11125 [Bdellovibrio sp. CG22_combo_CG10-13_8_21_14_all_39_27]